MTVAVEGAEDSLELGREDLINLHLTENDMVGRYCCKWADTLRYWRS